MSPRPLRVATVITRCQAGAGVVALRGLRALDPARFAVTLVAGSGDRLLDEAAAAGVPVTLEPTLRSPVAPADDVRALRRLTRVIGAGGFDVVHTHSAKAGTLGRLAARRAGVPRVVHTFHGLPFHEFQPAALRATYVAIERRLGRVTDVALCVGTGVAVEVVRRRLVPPDRVRTIGVTTDGPAVPRTDETRRAARRRLGLPEDARVVGAVGRLAHQKAPEHFLAALRTLHRSDVVGVWVGDGPERERIRDLADRESARGVRLVLVGERADVAALLPAFDLFALSSRYEGLPVAVVEAMRCGVPVVATAVNAVPDLVVPGRTGTLVAPASPGQLGAALAHLLDHPDEATRMAETARSALGTRHTATSLGEALAEAYLPTPPTVATPDVSASPARPPAEEAS